MLPAVHEPVSATDIAAAVRADPSAAASVVEGALGRAAEEHRRLNAFITVLDERARTSLTEVQRASLAQGPTHGASEGEPLHGALAGVPVVVKDNICVEGAPTTAASRVLAGFEPPYSATVVERLEAAGAVVIAKANLDEFGMGSTNETSAYGPVLNPLATDRVAGGSSGGSAAAVAAGVVPLALGTDTGGSVRLPAAFCGVIGFKPTYGALSRYGVIAYASSLDQVGVMARTVDDVRLAFQVMRGRDPRDATSLDVAGMAGQPRSPRAATGAGSRPRIGVITELAGQGMSAAALDSLAQARRRCEGLGYEVVDVSLPSLTYAVAAYYVIATAEASSNLARYDGMLYGGRVGASAHGQESVMTTTRGALFGTEVRRRILLGSFALSAGYYDAYYGRAMKVRRRLAQELAAALEGCEALLSPTGTGEAYALGEKLADPIAMYVGDVATCLANLGGLPAISLPCGSGEAGLPVGVQLMAAAGADDTLLDLAATFAAA